MGHEKAEKRTSQHQVSGKLFTPITEPQKGSILFLQGWNEEQSAYLNVAEELAENGYLCFVIQPLGPSQDESDLEDISLCDSLSNATTAYKFLVRYRVFPIIFTGHDLGCYLAVALTSKCLVDQLILQAPALYPDSCLRQLECQIGKKQLAEFRHQTIEAQDNTVLSAASQFKGDVLIISAEKDETIPPIQIENFLEAFKKQSRSLDHQVIPEADHGFSEPKWKKEVKLTLINWLSQFD